MVRIVPEASAAKARVQPRWKTVLLVIGVTLLVSGCLAIRGLLLSTDAVNRDFISYWSTGRLLLDHQNPYDPPAVLRVERSAGATLQQPFVTWNPPWVLVLMLPLGLLKPTIAALIWMVMLIVLVLAAMNLLRPPTVKLIPLTLIFFAPTLICIGAEQTSALVLFSVALFTRWQARRPFMAGLALTLALLKPHLLLMFWIVLVLEIARRRDFRIPAGVLTGFTVMNGLALLFDRHVWAEYLATMRTQRVLDYDYPNLSNLIRDLLHIHSPWPLAVPSLIGAVWICAYWARQSGKWDWNWHGGMAAAVSVLTAPYSWPYDQVLFLPAMLAAIPKKPTRTMILLAAANLGAIAVFVRHPLLYSPVYLWMSPTWMIWCIYAYWKPAADEREKLPAMEEATITSA